MHRFRLSFLASIIGLVIATTAWTGGAQHSVVAADIPIGATLYGTFKETITPGVLINTIRFTPTSGLQVRADIPDLRAAGFDFNDKAIALGVSAPTAAAAYSDINYQGTCETFFGPRTYTLDGTMVGARSISSIKLGATCLGPTTGKPVVTDITVADSPGTSAIPGCPNTYTRVNQDLNEGLTDVSRNGVPLGGDHLYLCVQYGPDKASSGVQSISLIGPFEPTANCCDTNLNTVSQACPSPGKVINTDLNKNVHGYPAEYLCVTKVTQGIAAFGGTPTYLRNITAFSAAKSDFSQNDSTCSGYLFAPVASSHFLLGTLNASGSNFANLLVSGLRDVYLCTSSFSGPDAATPMGDTVAPTISPVAVLLPTGCAIFCSPVVLTEGATVTKPGSVALHWNCSDDNDPLGTASPVVTPPATISGNGVYHRTGTCTGAWGNQTTKTFDFTIAVSP